MDPGRDLRPTEPSASERTTQTGVAIMLFIAIIVWGVAAGWVANLILGGGSRPADWGPLMVAGFSGSFVGGLLLSLISGEGFSLRPSGIIGTVLGAVVVLAIYQAVQGRKS